jgi:uncharacterized protein (DUF1684 family)
MRVLTTFALLATLQAATIDTAYRKQIEDYRQKREAALKADGGWLTVTGLFWLREGENTLGSDTNNDIVLPESVPASVGSIRLNHGSAVFVPAWPAVTPNGQPATEKTLRTSGEPDVLSVGPVDLFVIRRSERFGVRMKDRQSALRKHFTHIGYFPVREDWKIIGKFVPYESPQKLTFDTIIGEQETMSSPGYVEFEREGRVYRLLAAAQGKTLFFVIRDQTSGKTTYPASRFLHTGGPVDGKVVLDFNKLENPPCAFTPYATCPLPPRENRLSIAIEAGELKYGDH